jgi:hypothetical protein
MGKWDRRYKIIIPKEESKQIKCYCGHTTTCDCGEETLEEAAEKTYPIFNRSTPFGSKYPWIPQKEREAFIEGAKWQAERMYSDNEFLEFSEWVSHNDWVYLPSKGYWVNEEEEELEQNITTKELFEQFKKK